MFPPPMTIPTSTPISTISWISWAICCSVLGEMPYLPSPIRASPLSLRRMRLKRGDLSAGVVTGGGSYLAPEGRSRSEQVLQEQEGRHGEDGRDREERA